MAKKQKLEKLFDSDEALNEGYVTCTEPILVCIKRKDPYDEEFDHPRELSQREQKLLHKEVLKYDQENYLHATGYVVGSCHIDRAKPYSEVYYAVQLFKKVIIDLSVKE